MSEITEEQLFRNEKNNMNDVHKALSNNLYNFGMRYEQSDAIYRRSQYEEQFAYIYSSAAASAEREYRKEAKLVSSLSSSPYFSHMTVEEFDENDNVEDKKEYYLSDNENLETVLDVGGNSELLPFKKDDNDTFYGTLYKSYYESNGGLYKYKGANNVEIGFKPDYICDVEIKNWELNRVLCKIDNGYTVGSASDDLLEQIKRKNTDNHSLSNIIATLQKEQFDIISKNTNTSFAVQGCAGSGKTQCLIHRLFYLRSELNDIGWNKVQLITPTKLFRNYSLPLLKRYKLNNVNNCSIADLFVELIQEFEPNFKKRKYEVCGSEEKVNDKYLSEIGSRNFVENLIGQIKTKINDNVAQACQFTGFPLPATVDATTVEALVRELNKKSVSLRKRINDSKGNEEVNRILEEKDNLKKKYTDIEKKTSKISAEIEKYALEIAEIEKIRSEINDITAERDDLQKKYDNHRDSINKKIIKAANGINNLLDINSVIEYAMAVSEYRNITEGSAYDTYLEDMRLWEEYQREFETSLKNAVKNRNSETFLKELAEKKSKKENEIEILKDELQRIEKEYENKNIQISVISQCESGISGLTEQNEIVDGLRYFFENIARVLFEKVILSETDRLKNKFGIHIQKTVVEADGKKSEIRLLYKSDLAYYLLVFQILNAKPKVKDIILFCIDEAQDLSYLDYSVLHRIYPNAYYNLFGDVKQVLYDACGVKDWKNDALIDNVIVMNRNYRNSAAITEFCNRTFNTDMRPLGTVNENEIPIVVQSIEEIVKIVKNADVNVIVRGEEEYKKFRSVIPENINLKYYDSTSDNVEDNVIPCYSIFAAKGLEFPIVFVFAENMTENQRLVACTRATERLYYYG